MSYKAVIGLEIHAELLSEKKLFCDCENSFGGAANTRVCPVCAGFPGGIGFLGKEPLELSVKAGLVTDCTISLHSEFDRKNYFYPDLPKAYQITQQRYPLCKDGYIQIGSKRIGIDNIHLEEDAGKLVHQCNDTMIDYNRSGVPLVEIVTKPDISSADEAVEFLKELALRLRYAGVCDGKMEEGSLRVDVNVSLAPSDTRVEIKNLGSFKSVKKAIEYEISRQESALKKGEAILCQTRRFDEDAGVTVVMRKKETREDYRYFKDPDILPVDLTIDEVEKIRQALPVRPDIRYKKYILEYGLGKEEAKNIVSNPLLCDHFDSVCALCKSPKKAASLVSVGLGGLLNRYGEISIPPASTAEVSDMWHYGKISANSAMDIMKHLFLNGGDAKEFAKLSGMIINFDKDKTCAVIQEIIQKNESAVLDYKSGKQKAFGYLMGAVMSALGKGADPLRTRQLLFEALNN